MKKTLKIAAWIVGTVLGLLLVAILVVSLVFDPNQYKDEIVHAVKTATARDLRIEGKIGWTLFPRIGITTGTLELSNAPGFGREPFARVESATVQIELLPLISGHVNVDTVVIDKLTLNLAKDAAGRTNWDDLTKPPATKKPTQPDKEQKGGSSPLKGFAAGNLDIRRSTLTWHDQGSGDRYAVHNLTLSTSRIAVNQPIDVKLGLNLEYGSPVRHVPLNIRAQLVYAADKLDLKPLDLRIDDSRLSGTLEIRHLASPAYRFELALDQLDLDKYLPPAAPGKAGQKQTAATSASPTAPAVDIPLALLRALDLQGKLTIGKLKAFGVRSEDIQMQVSAEKGLLQFGPNRARLYSGSYSGRTTINVRGKTPQLGFEEKLEKIQLGPFLKDADIFGGFNGEANVALTLSAAGKETVQLKQTLNGKISIAIKDGSIEGVDLIKMENQINEAKKQAGGNVQQLIKALPELKPDKGDKTKFSKLGASASIANGIASNNDLAVEAPPIQVTGNGKINLITDTYDNYALRVSGVPLILSGSLSEVPKIRLDWNAIAKDVIKKEKEDVKERLEQKLRDRLKRR